MSSKRMQTLAFIVMFLVQRVYAQPCQVNVDLDLLGIGVRLGIYFQLTSNILLLRAQRQEAAVNYILTRANPNIRIFDYESYIPIGLSSQIQDLGVEYSNI